MTERISPQEFLEADGVGDWRVVSGVACAYFATGSFRAGVALVDAIGELADAPITIPTLTCGTRASSFGCRRTTSAG